MNVQMKNVIFGLMNIGLFVNIFFFFQKIEKKKIVFVIKIGLNFLF